MRLQLRNLLLTAGAVMLAACSQDLAVLNPNNADITRALARPSDIEALLRGGFNGTHEISVGGGNENLNNSYQVMAFENYTGLANFNMGPRAGLPRTPILNFQNNPGSLSVQRDYNGFSRNTRTVTLALERLASVPLGTPAQDLRAQAYGKFVLGVALGYLSMSYDSAAIVIPGADPVPPLVAYDSVHRTALRMFDLALVDATNPIANQTGGFPLPATWLNLTTGDVTQGDFVRIIRSYRARIRASVARNPAERAAVNWPLVIADVQAGITADLSITMNSATGWNQAWVVNHFNSTNWHVMTPFIIGMADSTGASYETWLNQPLLNRTAFLIRTRDRRFPAGDTRAAQNTASNGGTTNSAPLPGVYFRNRLIADDGAAADGTWGFSFYDYARFMAFQLASRIGPYPHMTLAEMNALGAEGAIRTGDFALAATLIDRTRVARGVLPALTGAGINNLTTPVPGGNSCVPRVPVRSAAGVYTTACGNIFEALKWEKRIETAFINYGAWYFDSRGWGDLAEGTPIHFPVPWQERLPRQTPPTNVGGVGQPGGAARGASYGFP